MNVENYSNIPPCKKSDGLSHRPSSNRSGTYSIDPGDLGPGPAVTSISVNSYLALKSFCNLNIVQ